MAQPTIRPWAYNPNLLEQLGFDQREFNGFANGFDLFIHSGDVLVADGWFLHHFGATDHGIPGFVEQFNH